MFSHVKVPSAHLKYLLLIPLLCMSGTLIVARWKAPDPSSAKPAASEAGSSVQQQERPTNQLEAEIVTITPTGFEPGEINRQQGRFILAVDNRSGLEEVHLYFERETGARINSSPTRKGKLAWRDVIDFPPGTYILRAMNDENWRCRITLTAR